MSVYEHLSTKIIWENGPILDIFLSLNLIGFKKGKNLNKVGYKAHDTAELFFEDVRLPASSVLGGLNKGFYQLMTELPQVLIQVFDSPMFND